MKGDNRYADRFNGYFEDISDEPDDNYTDQELEDIKKNEQQEQKKQYTSRQVEKYNRLTNCSLDHENKKRYEEKAKGWENEKLDYYVMDETGKVLRRKSMLRSKTYLKNFLRESRMQLVM